MPAWSIRKFVSCRRLCTFTMAIIICTQEISTNLIASSHLARGGRGELVVAMVATRESQRHTVDLASLADAKDEVGLLVGGGGGGGGGKTLFTCTHEPCMTSADCLIAHGYLLRFLNTVLRGAKATVVLHMNGTTNVYSVSSKYEACMYDHNKMKPTIVHMVQKFQMYNYYTTLLIIIMLYV